MQREQHLALQMAGGRQGNGALSQSQFPVPPQKNEALLWQAGPLPEGLPSGKKEAALRKEASISGISKGSPQAGHGASQRTRGEGARGGPELLPLP